MDAWELLHTLRQRWIVVIPVLLGGLLVVQPILSAPVKYAASARVLLRPSPAIEVNYLKELEEDMATAARAVVLAITPDGYGGRLGASDARGTFSTLVLDETGANLQHGGPLSGPILAIDVVANTPSVALSKIDSLIAQVEGELREQQTAVSVPPELFITPTVISQSAEAEEMRGSTKRAVAAVALLVVGASLAAATGINALLLGWRGRGQRIQRTALLSGSRSGSKLSPHSRYVKSSQ